MLKRVVEEISPPAILWSCLTVSAYTAIHSLLTSCTELLLLSSVPKQLLVKKSVEHNGPHSVWKVPMNRWVAPVWYLVSLGLIPAPIAFLPA